MAWFKRTTKGIQTPTEQKKDVQKGFGINPQQEKLSMRKN